jgi:hypothetical protein
MRPLASLLALLLLAPCARADVPPALAEAARQAAEAGDPGRLWRAIGCHADFTLERDEIVDLVRPLAARLAAGDMDTLFLHHATRLEKRGRIVTIDRAQESAFLVERPESRGFWFFVGARVRFRVVADARAVTLEATGLRYRSIWDDPDRRTKVRSFRFEARADGALWKTSLGPVPFFTTVRTVALSRPTPGLVDSLR